MADTAPLAETALVEASDLDRQLAQATCIEQVVDLAARMEALRRYCKRSRRHISAQNKAAHARLRCLRKVGEMLAAMAKERLHGVTGLHGVTAKPPTLAQLGISKRDSANWQRLASIPAGLFERHCRKIMDSGKPLNELSFTALARQRTADDTAPQSRETIEAALVRLRRSLEAVLLRYPDTESRETMHVTLVRWAKGIERTLETRATRGEEEGAGESEEPSKTTTTEKGDAPCPAR